MAEGGRNPMAGRVCPNAFRSVGRREMGDLKPRELQASVTMSRALILELSATRVIKPTRSGGLLWIDLDPVERRYLLSASVNSTVAIYDLQAPTSCDGAFEQHEAVAVNRGGPGSGGGHGFSVSGCCWYPIDTGLFVTSSYDNTVKLWDTNNMTPAFEWDLACKVYNVAMSPVASSHCLIAAGCEDYHIRLCDPKSGGTAHTLIGHQDSVWASAWSTTNDWQVFTGGKDGRLLAWDIRRAGVMWCAETAMQQALQRRGNGGMQMEIEIERESSDARVPVSQGRLSRVLDEQRTRPLERRKRSMKHMASLRTGSIGGPWSQGLRQASGHARRRIQSANSRDGARPHEPLGLNLDGSTDVRAVAHSGSVTGLVASPDCLHLLSSGTDSRLRLWDSMTGDHLLVHYADTYNRASKPRRFCVGADGKVLYNPSGSVIQVFEVQTGEACGILRGHFDTINCCVSNPATTELYSGAADGNIAVWAPPCEVYPDDGAIATNESRNGGGSALRANEDEWSD